MSDHEVPYAKIKSTKVEISDSAENKSNNAKPSLKDASPDNKLEYEDVLFRKLLTMDVPDCLQLCSNQKCQDEQQIAAIDDYAKEILAGKSLLNHFKREHSSGTQSGYLLENQLIQNSTEL